MIFASDNWAGASPKVLDALNRAAATGGPAYGNDPITRKVEQRFCELFERDVALLLVASGTVANSLALSAFARPGGVVFCHRRAHIMVDEAGATSFFGGGITLTGLEGERGKFTLDTFSAALMAMKDHVPHSGQPVAVSLTQITELGAAYSVDEIAAIADVAHRHGFHVHMDGARFANAVAALGVSPAELSWRAGVDALSFGGTKNGCLAAEAVVFFDRAQARDAAFQRQRAGQGFSKNWFLAAQLDAYLEGGHWLELAGHANRMAARLRDGIRASNHVRLAVEPDANELFAIVTKEMDRRLREAGARYNPWPVDALPEKTRPAEDETLIRLITSWQTRAEDVDRFAAVLGEA